MLLCTTLHFTLIHFTSQHCTALYFTVLHCPEMTFPTQSCTQWLPFTVPHFTTLHFTTLHLMNCFVSWVMSCSIHCSAVSPYTIVYNAVQCSNMSLHYTLLHYNVVKCFYTLVYFSGSHLQYSTVQCSTLPCTAQRAVCRGLRVWNSIQIAPVTTT